MAQELKRYDYRFDNSYTADTDTDVLTAGASGTKLIIQNFVIANITSTDPIKITIKFKRYDSGSASYVERIITHDFGLNSNDTLSVAELYNMVLYGDDTNPDKITVSLDTAPGTDEYVDIIASALEVS